MRATLTTVLAALSISAGAAAQTRETRDTAVRPRDAAALAPAVVERLEAMVEAERERLGAPGISLAILSAGEVVYAGGFGRADLEDGEPATAESIYRTASVAKPMTATAVLQLVELGAIELDAPIRRYCPAYPAKRWPVTVRHVLGHTAGIRHPRDAEDEQTT